MESYTSNKFLKIVKTSDIFLLLKNSCFLKMYYMILVNVLPINLIQKPLVYSLNYCPELSMSLKMTV